MAAHERLLFKTSIAPTFEEQLAKALPEGAALKLYHVSTPPNRESALYSAPPGERPDRTYCESHFLAATVNSQSGSETSKPRDVLAFAVEVLIYSTAYSTTLFVSKADSTGYLHLLKLPKGSPSPLREICSTFLTYLVDRRKRLGIPTIVSLFARAQDQYLFPGSVDNKGKHVLDDRGLVRWWCRVLDPLVGTSSQEHWESSRGYLIVPGLDKYETLSFMPRAAGAGGSRWSVGHPLQEISRFEDPPPRCLIPHFPDDPKSRYLDELDDELESSQGRGGDWKSVKSLDQFWEMMAFRQECSSGRLVGFIWVVFRPTPPPEPAESMMGDSQMTTASFTTDFAEDDESQLALPNLPPTTVTPNTSFNVSSRATFISSPVKKMMSPPSTQIQPFTSPSRAPPVRPKKKKLTGPIIPRQPRIKTKNRHYSLERPEKTPYYTWPSDSRGQIVLDEKDYKRMTELLQRLDFENLDLAVGSTRRWVNEVRTGAAGSIASWGASVIGMKVFEVKNGAEQTGVTTLNMGLVRKKRKAGSDDAAAEKIEEVVQTPQVNVLSAGMVRKKAKA
jgi:regulator of Ty1 transposition protein 109